MAALPQDQCPDDSQARQGEVPGEATARTHELSGETESHRAEEPGRSRTEVKQRPAAGRVDRKGKHGASTDPGCHFAEGALTTSDPYPGGGRNCKNHRACSRGDESVDRARQDRRGKHQDDQPRGGPLALTHPDGEVQCGHEQGRAQWLWEIRARVEEERTSKQSRKTDTDRGGTAHPQAEGQRGRGKHGQGGDQRVDP